MKAIGHIRYSVNHIDCKKQADKSQALSALVPPANGQKLSATSTWALAFHEKRTSPDAMSILNKLVSMLRTLDQKKLAHSWKAQSKIQPLEVPPTAVRSVSTGKYEVNIAVLLLGAVIVNSCKSFPVGVLVVMFAMTSYVELRIIP